MGKPVLWSNEPPAAKHLLFREQGNLALHFLRKLTDRSAEAGRYILI